MKRYFEYMDNVKVSDTLHQRLLELEAPAKRPIPWKKYGAVAAALVLVCGVGAWGLSRGGWNAATTNFRPSAETVPELAGVEETAIPDIAIVEPGDVDEPGMKTIGGYEVTDGEITSYFILPYIEFGTAGGVSQMSLDWDVPPGCVKRDLTQADLAALFGGEDALSAHLGWGDYELTGWAAWYEDGSFWGAFINGYKGPMDHFELAFTAGDVLPPTCIAYGADGVVNELWDVPVTAWAYDARDAASRRVEFLHDGYGFRFDLTTADIERAEQLVSRLTRWVIVEGLKPDAVTSDGAVLAHPWEADPNYGVGEPNYEPNWNDSVDGQDADTPAYDPREAADPSYNAPDTGAEE